MAAGFLSAAPKCTQADFDKLVDRYFDDFFHYNPTQGTSAGFHQYDAQLEDYSLAAIADEIRSLKRFLAEFEHFPAAGLTADAAADRDLVIHNIQSQLLEPGKHPHVGEESGQVLERHHEQRLRDHEPQFRAARRAA